jgi:signal transduction histidine kinase
MAALNASTAELQRVHEERMIKADRFSMIGQMATGLAHEIKNPLAGLSGALELLAEDLDDSPQRLEVITEMQHQVTRLEAIMGGLLNFARPPRAQLRTTDVNTSLSKVLFLMGQQRRYSKITVDSRLDPALPPVRADAGQLEQVFLNVCLNAYQAMGEGGGRLTLKSSAAQGQVLVEIADTGPGIPPEVRASIFTPFFTTRSNGTGLGLAMSVRMLAQHGGHLQFDCPEQGGTIFRITLPAEGGAPAA